MVETILTAVARDFGITTEQLLKERPRHREKQLARYFLRTNTHLAFDRIGELIGGVTRQAVISMQKWTVREASRDPELAARLERIQRKLSASQ